MIGIETLVDSVSQRREITAPTEFKQVRSWGKGEVVVGEGGGFK